MAVEKVGTAGTLWGVEDELWGYFQTFEDTIESQETTAQNGQGDIVAAAFHTKKGDVSFEAVIFLLGNTPNFDNIGKEFSLVASEFDFFPRSFTKVKSNSSFVVIRGTGSYYPEFSTPATTTTTTTT